MEGARAAAVRLDAADRMRKQSRLPTAVPYAPYLFHPRSQKEEEMDRLSTTGTFVLLSPVFQDFFLLEKNTGQERGNGPGGGTDLQHVALRLLGRRSPESDYVHRHNTAAKDILTLKRAKANPMTKKSVNIHSKNALAN
ncbi:hypothetical protein EYF80_006966 [Liparis tanakae]|uniref:Uncharacterized protein n=1 Tax=Liparis tanakae TaxID=230148 RepID=A0A4Z2IXM0_9TELE|nr:hypothetical protein EYF80_006966 [Liparis tanakae]